MIEPLAIEKYCDSLRDKIVFNHFNGQEFIDGQGIKKLTDVPQINSFVIRELFVKWKEETSKLKSPFFDFDHSDVQKALNEFLGQLSFHIKIDKDRFEYLLKDALKQVFEYLENPIYFLQEEIFGIEGGVYLKAEVIQKFKYLKLYPEELERLKADTRLQEEQIRADQIMSAIEDVFEYADIEGTEKAFIDQLEQIAPNNFVSFHKEPSLTDNISDTSEFVDVPDLPSSVEEQQNYGNTENNLEESVSYEGEGEDNDSSNLNDSFAPNKADEFSVELSPIDSLEEGISLHQKYYFIKELFDLQEDVFERALHEADRFTTFEDARDYLLDGYAESYSWDKKQEAATDLFILLNRKF